MSKGIGRLMQAGVAKEAVRGTGETAPTFIIPFSEASFTPKDDKIVDEQSFGVIEDSLGQSIVKEWSEIELGAPITDKSFGLILLAALGAVNSAANADAAGTVKDHTFTVAQSAQHQALTIFLDDPIAAADYKFALSSLSSLEISYELGKFVNYKAKFLAKKGASATITPSTVTENRFLPQNLTFKLASALSGLTGATAIAIKKLSITIEKNLESDDVLGSTTPADFLNKQFSVKGDIEAIWQGEADFKTAALAGTAQAMRIDLLSTALIGTAAHPQLTIDLAKIIFSDWSDPIKLDNIMTQTLSFKAHYSTADSKLITTKLTNLQASY